jgi:MFS family permease
MWPLYAAGFTTAFGAHAVAANLGASSGDAVTSLITLGLLLALYDGAEVLLKPVFGTVADRIGARPVLLFGLLGFAVASGSYVLVDHTSWLWLARLGQGAAASAFSPAASTLVARLNPSAKHGRVFGSYGFYKSLGYTAGPLLGGALVWLGGFRLLFGVMTVLAVAVAVWALVAVPVVPPLPRTRQTVVDLARRITDPAFVRPTVALAAATAALSVGVGFLPVTGASGGLGTITTGAAVSVLALTAAVVQPRTGRALDGGRLSTRIGIATGLALAAAGFLVAALASAVAGHHAAAASPTPAASGGTSAVGVLLLLLAAALIGAGTGVITPLGFAALARSTPPERLGQTMGTAELGRELGDAGGPILVAAVATVAVLEVGYLALAGLLALVLVLIWKRS